MAAIDDIIVVDGIKNDVFRNEQRGIRMISASLRPEKLSEYIIQNLKYKSDPQPNDFQLHQYRYTFEKIKNEKGLDPEEYAAYGIILFDLGKYDDFIEILRDGMSVWKESIIPVGFYTVGAFMLRYIGFELPDFDVYDFWFSHPLNADEKPILFTLSLEVISVMGAPIHLKKSVTCEIKIEKNGDVIVVAQPFKSVRKYSFMKLNNFPFLDIAIFDYADKIIAGTANEDEKKFIADIFYKKDYKLIHDSIAKLPSGMTIESFSSLYEDDEIYETVEEMFTAVNRM